jgi:hypothetical protein
LRRIDGRVEHLEPAFQWFVSDHRHDEEIPRPGRCHIRKPYGLCLIALKLLSGSLQQLDWRAAAERLLLNRIF